jgi:hypothetical protein
MITLGREPRQTFGPGHERLALPRVREAGPDGALQQDAGSINGTTVNGESVPTAAGLPRRLSPATTCLHVESRSPTPARCASSRPGR